MRLLVIFWFRQLNYGYVTLLYEKHEEFVYGTLCLMSDMCHFSVRLELLQNEKRKNESNRRKVPLLSEKHPGKSSGACNE